MTHIFICINLKRWLCLVTLLLSSVVATAQQYTVILDAGHGGKDPGAVDHGGQEKKITLGIVRQVGAYIKAHHPEVKVVYTRQDDRFVGLQARADFANKHKASLFVSVHVNSAGRGSTAHGTETYVLGVSKHNNNLSVAMRENQAMLLEDDYKQKYQGFDPSSTESYIMFGLMQEAYLSRSIDMARHVERQYKKIGRHSRGVRQDGFWVLSQSAMPSILTEVGFITNSSEANYLMSDAGQREMGEAIGKAFSIFYAEDNTGRELTKGKVPTEADTEADTTSSQQTKRESSSQPSKRATATIYRVQFMSSTERIDTSDKQFNRLKHKVRRTKEGRQYVYTIGEASTLAEAKRLRREISKRYPDSFVVEYRAGKRVGRV